VRMVLETCTHEGSRRVVLFFFFLI
jgi:hypothetical protein